MRIANLASSVAASLAFAGALSGCEPSVVVYDVFQPDDAPEVDALHAYASHAQVPLRVRAGPAPFTSIADLTLKVSGAVSVDPSTKVEVNDGVLRFALLTGDAGTGTLQILDKNGNDVVAEALTVDDADSITLAVTAPLTAGVQLPVVDPGRVRIEAGHNAGFRATLKRGATEIVGLNAVTATSADPSVTATNKAGCSEQTCDAEREAVDVAVAANAAETDVALSAGQAHLTMHIVPTAEADITDLVLDEGGAVKNRASLVAHVLAGTEPVFGAPVAWSIDGKPLLDTQGNPQHGDALEFDVPAHNQNPNVQPPTHTTRATIGDQQAAVDVASPGNFAATSITADCASARGSFAPVTALVVALGCARIRRRRA